jgi:hypothetical protein
VFVNNCSRFGLTQKRKALMWSRCRDADCTEPSTPAAGWKGGCARGGEHPGNDNLHWVYVATGSPAHREGAEGMRAPLYIPCLRLPCPAGLWSWPPWLWLMPIFFFVHLVPLLPMHKVLGTHEIGHPRCQRGKIGSNCELLCHISRVRYM